MRISKYTMVVTLTLFTSIACNSQSPEYLGKQTKTEQNETPPSSDQNKNPNQPKDEGVEEKEEPKSNEENVAKDACDNPDYFFCQTFDELKVGQTPQGTQLGANIQLVENQGKSGTNSLRFFTNNRGLAYHSSYMSLSNVPGKHWGRVYYKIENIINPAAYTHVSFVAGLNPNYEVRLVDTVRDPNGAHQYLYNFSDDVGGKTSSYNYTFDDTWVCAEWSVNNETQQYQFFRNGQLVGEISGSVAGDHGGIPASYQTFLIGGQVYQNGPDVSGWIDDLVLSTSRVECQ